VTTPKLARQRRFLERGIAWWLLTGVGVAFAVGAVVIAASGALSSYELFPALWRGYTPLGVLLGVLAAAAALGTFAYSLRRRWLQESLSVGRGTMAMWLASHATLGFLALVFAVAHAGYGAISLQASTGKLLLYLLLISAASGIVWRLVYAVVPRAAAERVGNYAADETLSRARAQKVELEKLAAGRSPELQALVARVLETRIDAAEAGNAAARLSPADSAAFAEIARLAGERHDALARAQQQRRYVGRLQGLRVLHVPLSVLFVVALPFHVLTAYDLPERVLATSATGASLGGFEPASTCERCHAQIVKDWRESMHAHALTSPLMVVQTNLAARTTLAEAKAPDPKNLCVNCHGPLAARITPQATLPLSATTLGDPELASSGIDCVVCHTKTGGSGIGDAALTPFQRQLTAGRTYFGPIEEPVGNAFHRSEARPEFVAAEHLCQGCHSVVYDRDRDGKIEKGKDLVLQNLFSEWQQYRASGGAHCVDCHMPALASGRAAEAALIPFEQDTEAPARRLRSHRFVGPDFPLDEPKTRDAGHAEREALLRRAGSLILNPSSVSLKDNTLRFGATLSNTGTGHNLPGGFAFVRQMWLEIRVLDRAGRLLAASGALESAAADLCDTELLAADNPLRALASGCATVDAELVNLQQRLVDKIEVVPGPGGSPALDRRGEPVLRAAPGAHEVVVQHLTSGAVARHRARGQTPVSPLIPGESRAFDYEFRLSSSAEPALIEARLLFRTAAPYFLRALAREQTPRDGAPIDRLIPNLEIIEMAAARMKLGR
jgi:hypothetical protein